MNHITAELDSLLTVGEDGGVLCGHLVSGQTFVVPLGHGGIICQHGDRVQVRVHGDQHLTCKWISSEKKSTFKSG